MGVDSIFSKYFETIGNLLGRFGVRASRRIGFDLGTISGKDETIDEDEEIHLGYICAACQMEPIFGTMFSCPTCHKYDLCEKCHENSSHSHMTVKHIPGNKSHRFFSSFDLITYLHIY